MTFEDWAQTVMDVISEISSIIVKWFTNVVNEVIDVLSPIYEEIYGTSNPDEGDEDDRYANP